MNDQLTTYTIKSTKFNYIWRFKYHLSGDLFSFEILEGFMNQKQCLWLFGGTDENKKFHESKFPIKQAMILIWMEKLKANFEITIGDPDLSFEKFWALYPKNPLSKKKLALERFNKLKMAERIQLFQKIPIFIKLKSQQNHNLPYAEVFINQRWWDEN